ncbi:MAG: CHAP domain-containing protein [Acinetobacter sp.]|uniref:hypothetical protein n=1 Tax=Acinetobacter TaxID=469 RepID=UPI0006AF9ACE|nr:MULTISPECIES: hypothetical protein [Acinetobacter]ALD01933.1 hypothetical protein AMQ28_05875 [Acinetobacter sp. TTH0-4]MBE9400187.1 CHAP domain-containing protein [Acinetobacter albensis]QPF37595.1 CHAP domain-containing protein [Acinetobacter sp. TTH0-4]
MIYDQHVALHDVYAPAATEIMIRSKKAGQNYSADSDFETMNKPEPSKYKNYSSANNQRIDIDKFIQKLKSITTQTSTQKCAKSIRIALESAGAQFKSHPVAAADWGNTLMKIGYRQISPKFDEPKEGDIYIINRTSKHTYGHIAGFSGKQWVSDFKQRSYDVYKENGLTYQYYRLGF